jgi:imidazoleglycerol-phosphate dehydratase/histidinol-phosphatase
MTILICSDRDGTINADDNYYLGKNSDWISEVELLPGVVEGIRLLNQIPGTEFFIITNQPGVAVTHPELAALTESRVEEVNAHVRALLENEGLRIRGIFYCPFADSVYAEKIRQRGWTLDPACVADQHPDLKPNIGMLEKSAQVMGKSLAEIDAIYVIGDRLSDVQTAINAGGKGIFVPSPKSQETKESEKISALKEKHPRQVISVHNFLEAAQWIREEAVAVF